MLRSILSLDLSAPRPNLTVMTLVTLQAPRLLSVAFRTFIFQGEIMEPWCLQETLSLSCTSAFLTRSLSVMLEKDKPKWCLFIRVGCKLKGPAANFWKWHKLQLSSTSNFCPSSQLFRFHKAIVWLVCPFCRPLLNSSALNIVLEM